MFYNKELEHLKMQPQIISNELMREFQQFNASIELKEKECVYEAFRKVFGKNLEGREGEVEVHWDFPSDIENALFHRNWTWRNRIFLITRIWYEYVIEEGKTNTLVHADFAYPTEANSTN